MKAQNLSSMGAGSSFRGTRTAFFIGPSLFDHVTTSMESPIRQEIFGPVLQIVRATRILKQALNARKPASIWQRRCHLHAQRPRRPRICRAGQCRDGRHQCADSRASGLSHIRRLEALGIRRYQPARHGGRKVSGQRSKQSPSVGPTAAWVTAANAFVIPTMG